MLENQLDKANEYIRIFQREINRKALLSFDIGIRIFEIVLFYQRGDDKFAEQQFTKFLRYCQDRDDVIGLKNLIEGIKNIRQNFHEFLAKKISLIEFEGNISKMLKGNQAVLAVLFINAARVRQTMT